MKKMSIIILALILTFSLTGCSTFLKMSDDSVPRDEIFAYVNENYELLEKFPYEDMPDDWDLAEDFVKDYLGSETIVDSVYADNSNILDFSCGGSGNATSSTYTGFYYSKDDTPYAMGYINVELEEIEPGIFEWKSGEGDIVHVEKIRNNWYYYLDIDK